MKALKRMLASKGAFLKLATYRKAHPDAEQPPDGLIDKAFNAIASGDLDRAPDGGTLGPSVSVTLQRRRTAWRIDCGLRFRTGERDARQASAGSSPAGLIAQRHAACEDG